MSQDHIDHINSLAQMSLAQFRNSCSICFTAQTEFCLSICKDQFCFSCFLTYVSHLITSYSVHQAKVACPVCGVLLRKGELEDLLNSGEADDLLDICQNKKYCSVKRSCCQELELVVHKTDKYEAYREIKRKFQSINFPEDKMDEFLFFYESKKFKYSLLGPAGKPYALQYYEKLKEDLEKCFISNSSNNSYVDSPQKRRKLNDPSRSDYINFDMTYEIGQIMSSFVSLIDEDWYDVMFLHLKYFYNSKCHVCNEKICFRCGMQDWHSNCGEYIKSLVFSNENDSDTEHETGENTSSIAEDYDINTLRWKYQNGKQCPRCGTFICREEGCNKIDCAVCMYKFCWVCLGEWSAERANRCSFYHCMRIKEDANNSKPPIETKEHEDNPEFGVPDVKVIMNSIGSMLSA